MVVHNSRLLGNVAEGPGSFKLLRRPTGRQIYRGMLEVAVSVLVRFILVVVLAMVIPSACHDDARFSIAKLATASPTDSPTASVTAYDLASIRDIGTGLSNDAISVSPDGAYVAFQLQQGDPVSNQYRTGWYVVETKPSGIVTPVGDGGDIVLFGELSGRIGGSRVTMRAGWSPDSEWIAYRLKRDGEIQLWRSHRDGTIQEQLTQNAADVSDFAWSSDGNRIFFRVSQSREALRAALRLEGEVGYLFDDRFLVGYTTAPVFADPLKADPFDQDHPSGLWVYDVLKRQERIASNAEQQEYEAITEDSRLESMGDARSIRDVLRSDRSGAVAWIENVDPNKYAGYQPPLVLRAMLSDGERVTCEAPECVGLLRSPSWDERGEAVLFLRREGTNQLKRGLYAWQVVTNTLRTILKTQELVEDCQWSLRGLICLHESQTTPRKIILIDPSTGSTDTLFDPNPEFQNKVFSRVEKLEWQEASGADAAGHLVYPVGYQEGVRYPLIIVQYRSHGFLRGGVGDEFPIHPLAANGFFVLSFDRPEMHELASMIGDTYQLEQKHWGSDFWERTATLSALEIAIDRLHERGLIDKKRVGITGLSDGAETVWYAMIHSRRFAAAAASSGGWSPSWFYLVNSDVRNNYFGQAAELPPPESGNLDRWRRISPEFHADSINVPILVQVSDHELVPSAATIGALMDAGKPIEAYVFPDEYHVKWQPKHKLAVYRRSIQWFNFWLRGVEDPGPEKAEQYARWRNVRAEHCEALKLDKSGDLPSYCKTK